MKIAWVPQRPQKACPLSTMGLAWPLFELVPCEPAWFRPFAVR